MAVPGAAGAAGGPSAALGRGGPLLGGGLLRCRRTAAMPQRRERGTASRRCPRCASRSSCSTRCSGSRGRLWSSSSNVRLPSTSPSRGRSSCSGGARPGSSSRASGTESSRSCCRSPPSRSSRAVSSSTAAVVAPCPGVTRPRRGVGVEARPPAGTSVATPAARRRSTSSNVCCRGTPVMDARVSRGVTPSRRLSRYASCASLHCPHAAPGSVTRRARRARCAGSSPAAPAEAVPVAQATKPCASRLSSASRPDDPSPGSRATSSSPPDLPSTQASSSSSSKHSPDSGRGGTVAAR